MATTQGAPPSNVSPNSMYAVKAMKADAIRNRSARRILHFRGGVSDRGRPKLDFSKFHIIRFALIRQNTWTTQRGLVNGTSNPLTPSRCLRAVMRVFDMAP